MKSSLIVFALFCTLALFAGWAAGEGQSDAQVTLDVTPTAQENAPLSGKVGGGVGHFSINSVPVGADVILDGAYLGETPVVTEVSSTGTPSHSISISRYGYETWTTTQGSPEPGETIYITARLQPHVETGSIEVTSSPGGAIARLDGGETLQTPATFTAVPAGRHTIEISMAGYFPYTTTVSVSAGRTSSVGATLSPMQATGSLRVSSSPQGAEVYIDEFYRGYTPVVIGSLSTGRHTVRLHLSGYQDSIRNVDITAGSESVVSLSMTPVYQPTTGDIQVSSVPEGAAIYLDGNYRGNTLSGNPFDITGVSPGTHTVSLLKSGYQDYSTSVSVTAGGTATISAALTQGSLPPATGSIVIQSSPSGADVYLDNVYKGLSPVTLNDVTAGSHIVTFRMSGYTDAQYTTTVTAGQSSTVMGMLSPVPTMPPTRSPVFFPVVAAALGIAGFLYVSRRR